MKNKSFGVVFVAEGWNTEGRSGHHGTRGDCGLGRNVIGEGELWPTLNAGMVFAGRAGPLRTSDADRGHRRRSVIAVGAVEVDQSLEDRQQMMMLRHLQMLVMIFRIANRRYAAQILSGTRRLNRRLSRFEAVVGFQRFSFLFVDTFFVAPVIVPDQFLTPVVCFRPFCNSFDDWLVYGLLWNEKWKFIFMWLCIFSVESWPHFSLLDTFRFANWKHSKEK